MTDTTSDPTQLVAKYMKERLGAAFELKPDVLIESIEAIGDDPNHLLVEFAPLMLRIHEGKVVEAMVDLGAPARTEPDTQCNFTESGKRCTKDRVASRQNCKKHKREPVEARR